MTTLKFGVTYPAGQQTVTPLGEFTRHVEALGYDSAWLIDNLASDTPGLECLTSMGFMAAISKTLTIGTSVLLLPLHNPVLLAHAMSSLDLLSDGRLILGIGVGNVDSHEAIGSDRRTRGARCEEAIALMKQLWSEEKVNFEGDFYHVKDYTLAPRRPRTTHVPIWIGGFSPSALARAGREASGFICIGSPPSECTTTFDTVDAHAKASGNPPLTRAVHAYFAIAADTDEASRVASKALSERAGTTINLSSAAPHVLGAPATCREVIEGFVNAGVTHFIFDPVCAPDALMNQLERLQTEVLQPLGDP